MQTFKQTSGDYNTEPFDGLLLSIELSLTDFERHLNRLNRPNTNLVTIETASIELYNKTIFDIFINNIPY